VLIYFAALAIYTSDVSDQKRGVFSSFGFGIVLVLISFASVIVAIYVILLDVFGYESLRRAYAEMHFRLSSRSSYSWVWTSVAQRKSVDELMPTTNNDDDDEASDFDRRSSLSRSMSSKLDIVSIHPETSFDDVSDEKDDAAERVVSEEKDDAAERGID